MSKCSEDNITQLKGETGWRKLATEEIKIYSIIIIIVVCFIATLI